MSQDHELGFGPDEELLRDLARRLLDEQFPVERLRALVAQDHRAIYAQGEPPRWDEGLWKTVVELGWPGLAIPEALGGAGVSTVGVAALVEEVGRHALPSPLLPTLATSFVLRAAGGPAAERVLARLAQGTPATLAIHGPDGQWEPGEPDVRAEPDGTGWRLSGRAHFVQDALKAELLLVAARNGSDTLLCAVRTDAPGLELSQDHIHDLTRDQATAQLDGVAVVADDVVSAQGDAALRAAWPALLVLVAADLCGTSEWQLQTTVEYARTRVQFDHPLGFFQAVKHPLVDAMVGIDRARSLLYQAAHAIDRGADDAEVTARMAKSAASDAGAYASDRSVQLHGGIGFTWECDVHLYFKRSLHNQVLLGDGVHQRRVLADRLIGPIGG